MVYTSMEANFETASTDPLPESLTGFGRNDGIGFLWFLLAISCKTCSGASQHHEDIWVAPQKVLWQGIEAPCQQATPTCQTCMRATWKVSSGTLIKCSGEQNLMRNSGPEQPSLASPRFLTHRNYMSWWRCIVLMHYLSHNNRKIAFSEKVTLQGSPRNTGWYKNELLSYRTPQSIYYAISFPGRKLWGCMKNTESSINAPLLNINQYFWSTLRDRIKQNYPLFVWLVL